MFSVFGLVRRVILLLVLLAVVLGVFAVAALLVGRPIVEDRLKSAVSGKVGSPVSISFSASTRKWLRGDVGDVTATAPRVAKGDVRLEDVRIVVRQAHLDMRKLLSRKVVIRHQGIAATAFVTEEELDSFARPYLRQSSSRVLRQGRVVITGGKLALRAGGRTFPLTVAVTPDGKLRIGPASSANAVGRAIAATLTKEASVGDLPYDVRLEDVRVSGERVQVTGGAPAGTITIE